MFKLTQVCFLVSRLIFNVFGVVRCDPWCVRERRAGTVILAGISIAR
jgi:hypothetical protein